MRKEILAAALFVCGACGGGGSSSNASVNGNIGGQSMGAQDSVSNVLTSGADSEGLILITNAPSSCAKLTANQQPKNLKVIFVELGTQSANGVTAPTANATYTVMTVATIANASGNVALASYVATDATCNAITNIDASSGTISLTRVDSNGYSGTFDITFADASHVNGSFTANKCAALSTNNQGTCI